MVHRIYVERKKGFRNEAEALEKDISESLGIRLEGLRIINRYDVEGIDGELLDKAVDEVFSEPQVDDVLAFLPDADHVFCISYLPGQFDQRAESARQCISFISPETSCRVRSGKVYLISGAESDDIARIKRYLINPVEAEETGLEELGTLETPYRTPDMVDTLAGFTALDGEGLGAVLEKYSLAMDKEDLKVFQDHFKSIGRNPTITELRVCDTYWSDHCRHTTFLTELEYVRSDDEDAKRMFDIYLGLREKLGIKKPVSLMDVATIGAKYLKSLGLAERTDQSEEINACSINIDARIDGKDVPYLLMFKNETHNHPTEIEPFGGAATCIGGAIRDPLSGRAYVYQAMRITGSGDVTMPFEETLAGKLPQRKIGITSAQGNSSYGNQIGLATGLVDEIYHPGYVAKHMELGAVVAAARKENVVRQAPCPGDIVILLGGRTGRDGIGGATGSSKSHKRSSIETCSAEVQKGNATEERKLQRLFRNPEASRMIKRCNDFGAGGVAVAIGELADGLEINLDLVPKKYQGLDGTEIAISESQERMAIVIDKRNEKRFMQLAEQENLEATTVATVTKDPVLKMLWNGRTIVSLTRKFLDTNGASKKAKALIVKGKETKEEPKSLKERLSSLAFTSRQGLAERFDSTIGAGTVLMPFGGIYQKTPAGAMCALIPTEEGNCSTASIFSYGYEPYKTDADPFPGAYEAVVSSICKIIAAGGKRKGCYLSLQEFFAKTGNDERRWGAPLAALLGALKAQLDTECPAIGGKDSMSGSFEDLSVPNTLVSFAINTADISRIKSPEFKSTSSYIYLIDKEDGEDMKDYLDRAAKIIGKDCVLSSSTVEKKDVDVTLSKLSFGNMIGLDTEEEDLKASAWSFIIESSRPIPGLRLVARTKEERMFNSRNLEELLSSYESGLAKVYPLKKDGTGNVCTITYDKPFTRPRPSARTARPKVLIPVFPGTNCEYDSRRAWLEAGANPVVQVINNLTSKNLEESIEIFRKELGSSNMLFIPGGFSGADEPDGSGKFITAFLRNPGIMEGIADLLENRDGLIGGICNGFQALIKLGLVPYGEFRNAGADSPTLTFNTIARHVSRLVPTRISSTISPWLSLYEPGEVQMVPVSHGEGRFIADSALVKELIKNGQIATQYVDPDGNATMDGLYNVNGSVMAVEGITSPDGRVFGRMGHIERCRDNLYKNVSPTSGLRFFKGAVGYFS